MARKSTRKKARAAEKKPPAADTAAPGAPAAAGSDRASRRRRGRQPDVDSGGSDWKRFHDLDFLIGKRRWRLLVAVAAAVLLSNFALYHEALLGHVDHSVNQHHVNDDVRQHIWPLFAYHSPERFQNDYVGDYLRAVMEPTGFKLLYRVAGVVLHPATFSVVLPYVLYLVLLVLMFFASWRLSGLTAAWFTVAFCLSAGIFLNRLGGGLPRSFALPVVALATVGFIFGRHGFVAAAVVLAGAFYPQTGVAPGLALAAVLLVLPARDRGGASEWSLAKRLGVLSATAVAAAILVLPSLVNGARYGPSINPADSPDYPEFGVGGRHGADMVPPFKNFAVGVYDSMNTHALQGTGQPWSMPAVKWLLQGATTLTDYSTRKMLLQSALLVVMVFGLGLLACRGAPGRRLLLFLLGVFLAYVAACALAPRLYYPGRYLDYSLPIFFALLIPAGLIEVARALWRAISKYRALPQRLAWLPSAIGGVACVAVLACIGGRGSPTNGIEIPIAPRPLFDFIERLPDDAMIAGWPKTQIENVPYACRRPVFLSFETHLAFHKQYADEMRRRLHALIDAYFATDPGPVERLHSEFGVTHLLVFKPFLRGEWLWQTFPPFEQRIEKELQSIVLSELALLALIAELQVFEDESYYVLDLTRGAGGAGVSP